jgi:hypothetical protein
MKPIVCLILGVIAYQVDTSVPVQRCIFAAAFLVALLIPEEQHKS